MERLRPAISGARLESYRKDECDDLELLINYYWNVALGEALYTSLHATEIALRNSIHSAFSDRFGNAEWWDEPDILEENDFKEIQRVREDVKTRNVGPLTPDQMVSRLSFGFWTHMVSAKYDESIWRPDGSAMVSRVFPYALTQNGKHMNRNRIGRHYYKVRFLRNRVAHFEQIFNSNKLISNHTAIQQGIGWINPALQSVAEITDRFPEVYYSGRAGIRQKLTDFIDDGSYRPSD